MKKRRKKSGVPTKSDHAQALILFFAQKKRENKGMEVYEEMHNQELLNGLETTIFR